MTHTKNTPRVDIAFCWNLPGATPDSGLAFLKECGFDGIELWPNRLDVFPLDEWRQALRRHGMRLIQLCPYFNFVSGDEKLFSSREQFRSHLYAAQELGCERIRVFTGPPWGEGVVGAKQASEAQWGASIQGLQEFCAEALAKKIELCLECHEGSLMEDSPSALRLLRAVNAPNLTLNLQLPFEGETPERSLAQLESHTTHIHIHNWTEGFGKGDLTYMDEGKADWEPIVRRLAVDLKRAICLSVEHVDHNGRHDPYEVARRDGSYLKALRSRLDLGSR